MNVFNEATLQEAILALWGGMMGETFVKNENT